MGYTTDFDGFVTIDPPLNAKQVEYINRIRNTRRMKRDVNKLMELYGGKHGYPFTKSKDPNKIYGNEGEYFAKLDGNHGQSSDASILDYNQAPGEVSYGNKEFESSWKENSRRAKEGLCQPGLWCQWEVSEDGTQLMWDGGEKFYNYVEWLKYLINHFFSKWKVKLNGKIRWTGEDSSDMGIIVVENNVVKTKVAVISYKDSDEE
jgi:hypothetical protein